MSDYKQVSITLVTAKKIDEIKKFLDTKGTPMQTPSIIGEAINDYVNKKLTRCQDPAIQSQGT